METVACEKQMWARTIDFATPLLTAANLKNDADIPAFYAAPDFDEKLDRRVLHDLNASPDYLDAEPINPDVEEADTMPDPVLKEPDAERKWRGYSRPDSTPTDTEKKETDSSQPDSKSLPVSNPNTDEKGNDSSADSKFLSDPNRRADEVVSIPDNVANKSKVTEEALKIIDEVQEEFIDKSTQKQVAIEPWKPDICEPGHDPRGNGDNDARSEADSEPYVKFVDVGGLKLPVNTVIPGGGHITGLGPILEEPPSDSPVIPKHETGSRVNSAVEVCGTAVPKSDHLIVDEQNPSPKDLDASEHSAIKTRPGPIDGIDGVSKTPDTSNMEASPASKDTEGYGGLPAIFNCSTKGHQKSTGRTPKKKKWRSRG